MKMLNNPLVYSLLVCVSCAAWCAAGYLKGIESAGKCLEQGERDLAFNIGYRVGFSSYVDAMDKVRSENGYPPCFFCKKYTDIAEQMKVGLTEMTNGVTIVYHNEEVKK